VESSPKARQRSRAPARGGKPPSAPAGNTGPVAGPGGPTPPDRLLVLTQRWQEFGDEEAYAELLREIGARLDQRARKCRIDGWDADDLTQEVVFRVHRDRGKFRASRGTLLGLSIAIHKRLNIDRFRRKKPTVFLSVLPVPDLPDRREEGPADFAERADAGAALHAALRGLSPRERRALTLLYFDDRSYEEVSALMGLSLGSLASLVHNAKQQLRARLRCRFGRR
jgi:RNA polymerase sigma-70 factor, ECF subfamily